MRRDVGKTNLSLGAQEEFWNFPGGPVVKTHASTVGGMDLTPDWGRSHMPHAVARKKKKRKEELVLVEEVARKAT